VVPILAAKSAKDFYARASASYNGDVPAANDTCRMFLFEDQTNCDDVSLFVVLDSQDGNTDGSAIVRFSGNFSDPEVADDKTTGADNYIYNSGTNKTTISWQWSAGKTDGLAQSVNLAEGDSINVEFISVSSVEDWQFVSGPAEIGTNFIDLNFTLPLNITRVACS